VVVVFVGVGVVARQRQQEGRLGGGRCAASSSAVLAADGVRVVGLNN
jgi:hypothetical protein